MPPKIQRHDDYAADRCHCNHLVYRDDDPGGECRFCPCVNHFSENRPSSDVLADQDHRFESHGLNWMGQ